MDTTLPHLLLDTVDRTPGQIAVRSESLVLTYGELADAAKLLSGVFHSLNLQGRRVGVLLPNVPAFPAILYGLLYARCSGVLLNPLYSHREVREFLSDSGADTVVTTSALAARLPVGIRSILVEDFPGSLRVGDAEGERTVPLASMSPREVPDENGPESEAAVVYTAAMEGWARGARLSHRNLVANLRSTIDAMQMTSEDRVLAVLPLIHSFGLTVTLNAPLAVGATVLPVERFHPARMLDLIGDQQVTVFAGVPAMYMALIAVAERRGVPEHSLRLAICGGAPLDEEVQHRWEEQFGFPLRQGYGLTEASPVCLFNAPDRPNRTGTLGYAFPGVRVEIQSPDGAELPDGEVGEICVAGDNVFQGYTGAEGRDPAHFRGDFFRTGDLGSKDPDGVVRFRGFLKPMFTRSGFNIYPLEIQRALQQDPRIARALVCSTPDPAKENEISLYVKPTAGVTLTEADVEELCRQTLAAFKQPGRIFIVDDIP